MLIRLFYAFACIAMILGFSSEAVAQRADAANRSLTVPMYVTDNNGNQITIIAYKDGAVTEAPEFPGGENAFTTFVNNTRRYPEEAYEQGIQGDITCQFLVDTNGDVKYVSLFKPKHANYLLVQEAIRVLSKMPRWQPGMIDGVPVKVRVVRKVSFKR